MNVIITGKVTYEIYGVETFQDAVDIFNTAVKDSAMEDTFIVDTSEIFATEIDNDGEIIQPVTIHEQGDK